MPIIGIFWSNYHYRVRIVERKLIYRSIYILIMQESWLSHLRYVGKNKNTIFDPSRSDIRKWQKMPIFGTQMPKIGIFWYNFDDKVKFVECIVISRSIDKDIV